MKKVKTPKARTTWGFSPVTRVVPSKKRYKREKNKAEIREFSQYSH